MGVNFYFIKRSGRGIYLTTMARSGWDWVVIVGESGFSFNKKEWEGDLFNNNG